MPPKSRKLIFECKCGVTRWGEGLAIVGNTAELGHWNPLNGLQMKTSAQTFPRWRSPVCRLSGDQDIEFKFIIVQPGGRYPKWEAIGNRRLVLRNVPTNDSASVIAADFDVPHYRIMDSSLSGRITNDHPKALDFVNADGKPFSSVWMGGEATFAKSHSELKEREGQHPSSPLPITTSSWIIRPLLEGHLASKSFLQKLQLVDSQAKRLLSLLEPPGRRLDGQLKTSEEAVTLLTGLSVFLSFIRSGAVPCFEDGGHHRPSHHAAASSSIFSTLCRVIHFLQANDQMCPAGHKEIIILLIRRILPLLPSFAESFSCSVPLTRIRDIAHRNDIPQELKSEIKHTLQNKLHRCCGPEDLVATEAMLKRIIERRFDYSQSFVSEFSRFYEELKDFFNAKSLVERLQSEGLQNVSLPLKSAVKDLLESKEKANGNPSAENLVRALVSSVSVRRELHPFKTSSTLSEGLLQEVWLTDISVEQYAFTVMSQLAQQTVEHPSFSKLLIEHRNWTIAFQSIQSSIEHIRLSGFQEEECSSLDRSYQLIQEAQKDKVLEQSLFAGFPKSKDANNSVATYKALFVKSVVERTRRLTEIYTVSILDLFPAVVRDVGLSVGVPTHAIEVFAEADVRASVVFQLSRFTGSLLNHVGALLGETGIEVIVEAPKGSTINGLLISVDDIWQLPTAIARLPTECIQVPSGAATTALDDASAAPRGWPHVPIIVRLSNATGDEEVGGLRSDMNVAGIILMHTLPHLSHLSIRARQENLPFIAVVNPEAEVAKLAEALIGRYVQLDISPDGGSLHEVTKEAVLAFAKHDEASGSFELLPLNAPVMDISTPLAAMDMIQTDVAGPLPLISGDSPSVEMSDERYIGAKAATCIELMNLSDESETAFASPRCWVLPFGTMETVLASHNSLEQYCALLKELEELSDEDINAVPTPTHIKPLVTSLKAAAARGEIPTPSVPLIARSSANVEDRFGMSAAGLYESVANVNPIKDVDQFARSVSAVWASLHSRRAVLSRRYAEISQGMARMALLIQDLVRPYLSFVVHTKCPAASLGRIPERLEGNSVLNSENWIYVELALGLGEVLASGSVRGLPFRMVVHKATGTMVMLSWASFNVKYEATAPETLPESRSPTGSPATEFVTSTVSNYFLDPFSLNHQIRHLVAQKILAACCKLEAKLGGPQDIEGSIVSKGDYAQPAAPAARLAEQALAIATMIPSPDDYEVVIVQSRPQP